MKITWGLPDLSGIDPELRWKIRHAYWCDIAFYCGMVFIAGALLYIWQLDTTIPLLAAAGVLDWPRDHPAAEAWLFALWTTVVIMVGAVSLVTANGIAILISGMRHRRNRRRPGKSAWH